MVAGLELTIVVQLDMVEEQTVQHQLDSLNMGIRVVVV
jgi:hypothetical protein